jgi:hypothetical protein
MAALKIGVYLCSGPNPIFLRAIMLQLEAQRWLPRYIAVHENSFSQPSYQWCCEDVSARLYRRGVDVLYLHTPTKCSIAGRFGVALQMLLATDCDTFLCMGADNFFYEEHIETLAGMLGTHDWVLNTNNEALLVRYKPAGNFLYNSTGNLAWNPIGGMPDNIVYNRKFAEIYAADLAKSAEAEDIVMGRTVGHEGLDCARIAGPTTCCYVSHGTNESTANWQDGPPPYFDATWGKS